MTWPKPRTTEGRHALTAVIEHPQKTLLATDFDGVLARIVGEPEKAYADPAAVAALSRLGGLLGHLVVITGRPAQTAIRLGRLREQAGLEHLVVLGQYGVERWDAATDRFIDPPAPDSISDLEQELVAVLADLGLSDAKVEHKGRAVGVHTRQLADPETALERLHDPIARLAERHGYAVQPGKNVLEIRTHGIDKGDALRAIVAETGASQVVYAGDDLGDLPAFEAVIRFRSEGMPAISVFAASTEREALLRMCDLEVDGVTGVTAWLTGLAEALEDAQPSAPAPLTDHL